MTATDAEVTTEATETTEEQTEDTTEADENADQFPRDYVERIRRESAGYRDKAKAAETRAEDLARQLFTARVSATGKLADATDLEWSADLDDADKVNAAVDELLTAKPHLASRTPRGNVGQGAKDSGATFSMLSHLKSLV
ncbi:hypothetical protein [Mycobacterium sp. JS623]|uniref:hypothetical protein n=1 Tax=Mycobacterium sp. JS623 TaxID=212767 RepID=UPI00059B821F|nr:hypothetical protein [Mycobacterium sp. JS623]